MSEVHNLIDAGAYFDGKEWHYGTRCLECEEGCGYLIAVPFRNNRPFFDEKIRISHEYEIQDAISKGVTGAELYDVCQRYAKPHAWSSHPEILRIVGVTVKRKDDDACGNIGLKKE